MDILTHPLSLQVMSDHNLHNIRIKPSIQIILQLDAMHFKFRNIVKFKKRDERNPSIENIKYLP